MREAWAALLAVLASLGTPRDAHAQDLGDLEVGHWVEVKGELGPDGAFAASAIEALAPGDDHVLIGTARAVDRRAGRFELLGRAVSVDERTRWDDGLSLDALEGRRVKVEGRYKGPERFEAREIAPRGEGRDRIVGRVDALDRREDGLELSVAGFRVRLPLDAKVENEEPFADLALAPEVLYESASGRLRDEDDFIPGSIRLGHGLSLGGLLEYKGEYEDEYDLDEDDDQDDRKQRLTFRAQLAWHPSEGFRALLTPRYEVRHSDEQDDPREFEDELDLKEAWFEAGALGRSGVSVRVGRQDFDEPREWIYKADLDAVRATYARPGLRLELSASTVLAGGEERDEETDNFILYLSNDDRERHLAAWIVDRRDDRSPRDSPFLFGARALGEWLPDNESWLEASGARGFAENREVEGWAFDVGTTWKPDALDPVYFSAGYAFATGDDAESDGTDEAYRQSGFQRNNAKLGGVTSFRYYGEVLEPELSNLGVLTLGVGSRIARRVSLDLVWHAYRQDVAAAFLRDSNLDAEPDGESRDLGQEIDLVFGWRRSAKYDFEVVLGRFDPGEAFDAVDEAWHAALQWRMRF